MRLTARDLLDLGIIDAVVPEPLGGAHRDVETMAKTMKETFLKNLKELKQIPVEQLVEARYEKFRKMGIWAGGAEEKPAESE